MIARYVDRAAIVSRRMRLAGLEIAEDAVAELVWQLRDQVYVNQAEKLDAALARGRPEVALSINDRNAILDVLDDPPTGLERLREVLLAEYVWRVQIGLERRSRVN